MASNGTRPVAGYFRVSQARDDMSAPEVYYKQMERYCQYKDLTLEHVFSDIDYWGLEALASAPGWRH